MSKVVYHGSPKGDIEIFKPNVSTHQINCIYATDNKTIALLYMSRSNGDLDTDIEIKDGKIILVERRAGVLDNIYNKGGYLYELDGESFNHYDFLWDAEVISYEENLKPIRKTYYDNILKEIEKAELSGEIIIYRYPNRPKEIPLDNSDLIDKYISFYKMGNKGIIDKFLMLYPELKEKTFAKMEMPETLYYIVKENRSLDNIVAYDNILDAIRNCKMGEMTMMEYSKEKTDT